MEDKEKKATEEKIKDVNDIPESADVELSDNEGGEIGVE